MEQAEQDTKTIGFEFSLTCTVNVDSIDKATTTKEYIRAALGFEKVFNGWDARDKAVRCIRAYRVKRKETVLRTNEPKYESTITIKDIDKSEELEVDWEQVLEAIHKLRSEA